jgi:ubiquinone/menaquinone biosynthesis C-methylase UbiE
LTNNFNRLAKDYDLFCPDLPEEYINLIQSRFSLRNDDRIIDLGCGTGKLTLDLARFSRQVEGVDISQKMLNLALIHDVTREVSWICCPIEKFDFGIDRYKLIFSFEAFHLFQNAKEVIKKCAFGLNKGGFLCIGWVEYGWEPILKDAIIKVFQSNGIEWGEWGYQSCNFFLDLAKECKMLSFVTEEYCDVKDKRPVSDVAYYLGSIGKAGVLNDDGRKKLIQELIKEFQHILSSDVISHVSRYYLSFCSKKS